ncbi:FAD-dependent monooxygenase [Salibacterium qingdaonense]|uniref:2-polyprenyl-6-methoxyphenol hydroxylase n=1 Tax=Salibacterium qingdaonense TaxID=266892 RepID=A0A1I4LPV6_9BACI|nr:FAD-dependent monooxygenase [Salibacterium qingdaonense]SFL92995.1 2-polyprenyl-6-methoxyphenol hydroxylase [Salibacterium qingdaonense]
MTPQVLIAGAGPTGLALALALEKHGISFRIMDQESGPGEESRAMAVHARTLEWYDQLGAAGLLIQHGYPLPQLEIYRNQKRRSVLDFQDMGRGFSPYPYVLILPQDEHERLLINRLKKKGIEVEWNTELSSFWQHEDHVEVVMEKENGRETSSFTYVCGCDGAHSSVRKALDLPFAGKTDNHVFYVMDVKSSSEAEGAQVHLFEDTFGLVFPIRTSGLTRLIGLIPERFLDEQNDVDKDRLLPFLEKQTGVDIERLHWFSTYTVHHRVSSHFRKDRVFLAGDAAHIHSPAGAQGMNTGIGDAVNLAWKLAAVIQGTMDASVLDTYETERRAFAKRLVATTDQAFQRIAGDGMTSDFVRKVMIPRVIPWMTKNLPVKQQLFKTVSQIRIHYRNSRISSGKAGRIQGGDRLPWLPGEWGDNFGLLQSADWQLHVYGSASPDLRRTAEDLGLPLHEPAWTSAGKEAGIPEHAMFLIRPDGYVALADARQNTEALQAYLGAWGM